MKQASAPCEYISRIGRLKNSLARLRNKLLVETLRAQLIKFVCPRAGVANRGALHG